MPEAARAQIVKLRSSERPYPEPDWAFLRSLSDAYTVDIVVPCLHVPPEIQLRDYQLQAIESWFEHDCCGLLEMATGTGKTITSLAAIARLCEREQRLAVVVAVPYQHLVDQWRDAAEAFGLQPILAYQNKARWLNRLHQQVMEFNWGDRNELSVFTTHSTFIDEDFQRVIGRLTGQAALVADEVHHLGAERSRTHLPENIPFRLALSATPDRWFDDVGTAALREYFGKTVFSFTLADAIRREILTPYVYYPQLVELGLDPI